MSTDADAVLGEAVRRLLTPAGAVLALSFALASLFTFFAPVGLLVAMADVTLEEALAGNAAATGSVGPIDDGLGPTTYSSYTLLSLLLVLLGVLAGIAVLVVAIDAFGRGIERPADLGPDRFAWKFANVLVGWVLWAVAVIVGSLFFGLGLALGALTMFFPVAVVLDDQWVGAAAISSVEYYGDNPGLALVALVVAVFLGAVSYGIGFVLTTTGALAAYAFSSAVGQLLAAGLSEFVSAVLWSVTWATLSVAYAAGSDDEGEEAERDAEPRQSSGPLDVAEGGT